MKKSFLALVILAAIISFLGCVGMQVVPPEERVVQQVHEVDLTKDQIFSKCLEWMAQSFVDSKEVIELKDKENGKIIGKGVTDFMRAGVVSIPCRFTMIVEIKDSKYRTTYKNFIGLYREQSVPLEHKGDIDQVKESLLVFDRDLYVYLTSSKKADDW
jgi:hypothetical protein